MLWMKLMVSIYQERHLLLLTNVSLKTIREYIIYFQKWNKIITYALDIQFNMHDVSSGCDHPATGDAA